MKKVINIEHISFVEIYPERKDNDFTWQEEKNSFFKKRKAGFYEYMFLREPVFRNIEYFKNKQTWDIRGTEVFIKHRILYNMVCGKQVVEFFNSIEELNTRLDGLIAAKRTIVIK